MAGFETRAIWGSDPGLVSDRFRYTGASVPPLDEEAIKRIQENAKQFLQAPLPSPSNAVKNPFVTNIPPLFSLNTNELNLQGTNPFHPGWQAAEQEWERRLDANLPEGSALDRLIDFRERAGEWDAMQQGAIFPGRIGGIQPNPVNPARSPSWLRALAYVPTPSWTDFSTDPNRPAPRKNLPTASANATSGPFQDLLQNIRKAGSEVADVLVPGRHNVPQSMLEYIETPEFAQAKREQNLFGSYLGESIAPGELSEKQSRWLLDPRRTPQVGAGAFGAVTVPTNTGTAFKIQEKQSKAFLENELDKAIRTAELGLGPQVYSATLQPIEGKPELYRGITRTEAVPHRQFNELMPEEQRFLALEKYKLNEGLYRGGIVNKDSHYGNILLNDVTKQATQVDSGLARDYDAFDPKDLNSRLSNIVSGLYESGLRDVARDTDEIGLSLIDEIRTKPSPELYAEAENFFNRSGNLLMSQSRPLPSPGTPVRAVRAAPQVAVSSVRPATKALLLDAGINYALGASPQEAVVTAVTDPISAESLGGAPTAPIERLGPRGEFVDTRSNTVLSPQGRYTNTGIAYKGGKPIIVPRGSVAGEGNFATQAQAVLNNAINTWRRRLGALGIFRR